MVKQKKKHGMLVVLRMCVFKKMSSTVGWKENLLVEVFEEDELAWVWLEGEEEVWEAQ